MINKQISDYNLNSIQVPAIQADDLSRPSDNTTLKKEITAKRLINEFLSSIEQSRQLYESSIKKTADAFVTNLVHCMVADNVLGFEGYEDTPYSEANSSTSDVIYTCKDG